MSPARACCLLLMACLVCAGSGTSYARAQELSFIHYNTGNTALPHDVCYELMQDTPGYLWVGTDNGLARFDGRDMKIYKRCFRSPFVIVTAQYDSLFLAATWTGGVYKLMHDTAVELYSTESGWLASVNRILFWKNIVLLYHFDHPGYFRFNERRDSLISISFSLADTGGHLTRLYCSDDKVPGLKFCVLNDRLIAYGDKGMFSLADTTFRQVSRDRFDHLVQARDGSIYGFYESCLYRLSADLRSSVLVDDLKNISDIAGLRVSEFNMLPSGNMVLRLSYSVYEKSPVIKHVYINRRTHEAICLERFLNLDVFISDIIADHENGFWVATDGAGIYHVFEPRYLQYGSKNEFRNPFVTALMQVAPGQVYIGTKSGVYLLEGNRLQLVYPGAYVKKFFRDSSDRISVQMYLGDHLQIKGNRAVKLAQKIFNTVTPHYIITEGTPWPQMVTDRLTGKQLEQATRHVPVYSRGMCEDKDGCIWNGCDMGLYWWRKGDTAAICYPNSLPGVIRINQLFPDSLGGLWVGTAGAGLFYLRHEKILFACNEQNGLSNASVTALLPDGNKLWIGTPNGLNMLDCSTGHISVYKKYDGLISDDVTTLANFSDSEIVIGSSMGITIFHKGEQVMPASLPRLTLEQVLVDDRPADVHTPVTGNYQSRISLAYNVVSFVCPELVRFEYRLSDDDAWIGTANKSIVLTNLAPGEYKLQVRAHKYNSEWSAPLVLPLEIRKPWWRSAAFYIAVCLVALLCVYLVQRSRSAKTHKKLLQQQQFAELKLKALQAQLNPHFVSNALSAIQFFILVYDEVSANDYLAKFAGLTRLLLESSRNRFVPLKDELQIVTYYFELEKLRFKDVFVYDIEISADIDTGEEWLPGVLLQPFIENSINHGIVYLPKGAQGHVSVRISRQDGLLLIDITDNGVGRQRAGELQKKSGREHTSRSAEIITEISQSVNNLEGCRLQISVIDLIDEQGWAAGTKVQIRCFIAHKYKPYYADDYH